MKLLQQTLFEKALAENKVDINNHGIRIDLENAICYLDNKEYPVTFPQSYVDKINSFDKTKTISYNFKGNYFPCREWTDNFSGKKDSFIKFTEQGKKIEKEKKFDEEYYKLLCASKFTLCPAGDFKWSYRFFESCLCKSIPIVENKESIHKTMNGFKYYLSNDKHEFREDWIKYNYDLFIKKHTLLTNYQKVF